MDNRHISFITLPHSPHVNPTFPVVSALVRRGYRVTYATSERFASVVQGLGAEVVPCPRLQLEASADERNFPDAPRENFFTRYAASMLDAIRPFLERNRPDLILYDFTALAGRILASQWNIPAIQTSPFYAFDESVSFESQMKHPELRTWITEHAQVIAQYLKRNGVVSNNYHVDKERLNIYLFSRVLQPNSARFGANCYFAGRCAAERLVTGKWQGNSDGRPIALIAMSTLSSKWPERSRVPEYFGMCMSALPSLGWHVVLAIGEHCATESLTPLPAHCEIVKHTSYLNVLSRAKLLCFMSGIASTTEAAYHGIPMIAISEGVGEYEWQSDRIVELGIGAHLRKGETSMENIRGAAIQLSSDAATLHRVKKIERIVRREPGGEDTANRIEDYLDECS